MNLMVNAKGLVLVLSEDDDADYVWGVLLDVKRTSKTFKVFR